MLFIRRHGRQSAGPGPGPGPGPEEYAIYDTSLLSQYVAYDTEGSEYDHVDHIMGDNYQILCSYIPQYFTGTDNINRQFIAQQNYHNRHEGWSLIEICFAPYSVFNDLYGDDGYNGGYIHLDNGDGGVGLGYNENGDTVMVGIDYTRNPDYYDETQGYIRVHYDGTRVLMTVFLVFIEGTVRIYLAVDDGFDEYDDPNRLITSNLAYLGAYKLGASDTSIMNNIADYLQPHIGDYKEFSGHSSTARIYSVRTFKGMGTLSGNALDNTFKQHFDVDKHLFLADAMAEYGGENE